MKNIIESQKTMILDHLLTGCKINPLEASKQYGCSKLSTRVGELQKEICRPINRRWIDVKTRFGDKRVMQYWL